MKHILLITTGGTIASLEGEEGLSPAMPSETLLHYVPEIAEIAKVSTVSLYNLDSTNMRPEYWLHIARHIREVYNDYDGFVITHGTDTMAYAAAMLYYLIQHSPKPVVLTGAQIPIHHRDTDARNNLYDAFLYATDEGASGVHVVFDDKVIAGTRARKTRTRSFNAFDSVDFPVIAEIHSGRIRYYIREKETGPVTFYDEIDPKVLVIKLVPGMSADIFDFVAEHAHAVIIESFGVGGIPYYNSDEFASKIELLLKKNVRIVVTTQVPHEGSNMSLYQVGLRIKQRYELPEAYDMTTEAVLAKVMWALPQTHTHADFCKLFLTPVGKDIH